MKVLIYLEKSKVAPTGGPSGVGFHLKNEMEKRAETPLSFRREKKPNQNKKSVKTRCVEIISRIPLVRYILKARSYKYLLDRAPFSEELLEEFQEYDAIHFHTTFDLFLCRGTLEKYTGKVLLTSHSPVPFAQEFYTETLRPIEKRWFGSLYKRMEEVDLYAFNRADFIIFPCPEAEEPYESNWDAYKGIRQNKSASMRYALTGIPPMVPRFSRSEIRAQLGLSESDFLIAYAGRHNCIKGFDNLKLIGERILEQIPDSQFVICGKEAPLAGLKHKRWREIGWTKDVSSYISASDIFVLPNKETYFDLIMLEVMSLGKIVVASRTGGNKYYERMRAKGVFLYDTIAEAVQIINSIRNMSETERSDLSKSNLEFFQNHLTVEHYYDQYIDVLKGAITNEV